MKRYNKAFTLTELLVALGVIGILCAILLPVIFNLLPNQNTIMAKRAYYLVQTTVADLINDEGCYPDKTKATETNKRYGFDDGYGYANCEAWGGTSATSKYIETEGRSTNKFMTLFKDKIDIAKDNGQSFTTKDGIDWYFIPMEISLSKTTDAPIVLIVDVNGSNTKPNCSQENGMALTMPNATHPDTCKSRTSGFDRFRIDIYRSGKITISDNWAADAVKIDKDITEDGTK